MGVCRLVDNLIPDGSIETDALLNVVHEHGVDYRLVLQATHCVHSIRAQVHDEATACLNAIDIDEQFSGAAHVRHHVLHALASQHVAAHRPRDARRALTSALQLSGLGATELAASYRRLGILLLLDSPFGLRDGPPGRDRNPPSVKLLRTLVSDDAALTSPDATAAAPTSFTATLTSSATAPTAALVLRAALALEPQDALLQLALGTALVPRAGDFSVPTRQLALSRQAATHLSAAVRLRPACEQWHLRAIAVWLRARLASPSELVGMAQAAVAMHPLSAASTQQLVSLLQWDGRPSEARATAARAVASGMWPSLQQRPVRLTPGLEARPVWDHEAAAPGLCSALRHAHRAIAEELRLLERTAGGCTAQDEGLHLPNSSWRVCDVYAHCVAGAARLRATCAALRLPAKGGRVLSARFSLLGGGGVVQPHTGPNNRRLLLHFGVRVPDEHAFVRVGWAGWHRFEEGGCFAFDDSFEHEVRHHGEARRDHLVVQVLHPGLLLPSVAGGDSRGLL